MDSVPLAHLLMEYLNRQALAPRGVDPRSRVKAVRCHERRGLARRANPGGGGVAND